MVKRKGLSTGQALLMLSKRRPTGKQGSPRANPISLPTTSIVKTPPKRR